MTFADTVVERLKGKDLNGLVKAALLDYGAKLRIDMAEANDALALATGFSLGLYEVKKNDQARSFKVH